MQRPRRRKRDWRVMQTLVAAKPRQQVIEYLGFSKEEPANGALAEGESQPEDGGDASDEKPTKNRLSNFFADGDDGDDFLADLAATKGAKTDNPFHLFKVGNTSLEDKITKALMLGDFRESDRHLRQGRSHCGRIHHCELWR